MEVATITQLFITPYTFLSSREPVFYLSPTPKLWMLPSLSTFHLFTFTFTSNSPLLSQTPFHLLPKPLPLSSGNCLNFCSLFIFTSFSVSSPLTLLTSQGFIELHLHFTYHSRQTSDQVHAPFEFSFSLLLSFFFFYPLLFEFRLPRASSGWKSYLTTTMLLIGLTEAKELSTSFSLTLDLLLFLYVYFASISCSKDIILDSDVSISLSLSLSLSFSR